VTAAAAAFGRRLRDTREQHGISLDAVAEATKIKLSLLAGLERGDVSGWPRGIFRRAFVREYAAAIRMSPSAVLTEFSKLFPEEGEPRADGFDLQSVDEGLRLTLAAEEPRITRATILRVAAALVDFGLLVALAALISYLTGAGFWLTNGVVALIYYGVSTASVGQSAASWWLQGQRRVKSKRPKPVPATRPAARQRFQIVSRRSLRGLRSLEADAESARSDSFLGAALKRKRSG
jgi:transcriptional regulator with XRE-family HTH domain